VRNLIELVASGVSVETLAPDIKQREAEIAKLDAHLRTPRPARPDIEKLRSALNQRAASWKADLRAEPTVARTLLRRLVGPLTLWDGTEPSAEWIEWETSVSPALLEGLTPIQVVACLMPCGWNQVAAWLQQVEALRRVA
jgi:hypothetical protein